MAKDHEREAAEQPVDEEKIARIAKNIFAMPPEPRKKKAGAAKPKTPPRLTR